jgi:uncharacterized protein YjbI with pentapeptide repeats
MTQNNSYNLDNDLKSPKVHDFTDEEIRCRGRKFTNETLRGANFTNRDIRGCNFTGAKLIGANFTDVIGGLQKRWIVVLFFIACFIAVISGFASCLLGIFISLIFNSSIFNKIFGYLCLIIVVVVVGIIICQGLNSIFVAFFAIAYAVAIAGTFAVAATVSSGFLPEADVAANTFSVAATLYVSVSLTFAVAVVVTVVGGSFAILTAFAVTNRMGYIFLSVISIFIITIAFIIAKSEAVAVAFAFAFAKPEVISKSVPEARFGAIVLTVIGVLLNIYIAEEAIRGNKKYSFIWDIAIAFTTIGGTNFSNADLTEANFKGATLKNTDFTNATLTRTCFRNMKLLNHSRFGKTYLQNNKLRKLLIEGSVNKEDKNFDNQDLQVTNLQNATLTDANFAGANLSGANLTGANLSKATLTDATLKDSNLSGATLTDANFAGANLRKANLQNTNLTDANFAGTNLSKATLTDANLSKVALTDVDLEDANLSRANLKDANLSRANLTGANLSGATLTDANFAGANLRKANLQDANLTDASFASSDLSEANLTNTTLLRANLVKAIVSAANLTGANLTGAYIEDWSISRDTKFDDIICEYVFMRYPTKEDPDTLRKPDNKEEKFAKGDFANFIRPICETLDLYHKQGYDPRYMFIALNRLDEKNKDAQLKFVSWEERGDNYLIKLKVAKGADKSSLHSQYFQEYNIILCMPEPEKERAALPYNVIINHIGIAQNQQNNSDNNMTQPNTNIQVGRDNNGVINLGPVMGSIDNKLQKLQQLSDSSSPDKQRIKELLIDLKETISKSSDSDFPLEEKENALNQVETLTDLVLDKDFKTPPNQKAAKTAITMLKGIFVGLPTVATLAEAASKLLPMISKLFGF